jgi:hypothetical protein
MWESSSVHRPDNPCQAESFLYLTETKRIALDWSFRIADFNRRKLRPTLQAANVQLCSALPLWILRG